MHLREPTLTGRARHRSERKWGRERLILQVEETGLTTEFVAGQVDSRWVTRWRDATTEDLPLPDTASTKG